MQTILYTTAKNIEVGDVYIDEKGEALVVTEAWRRDGRGRMHLHFGEQWCAMDYEDDVTLVRWVDEEDDEAAADRQNALEGVDANFLLTPTKPTT